MELTHDWKGFRDVFIGDGRGVNPAQSGETTGPIYCVTEGDRIAGIYAAGEDLSEWLGAKCQDIVSTMQHRELLVLTSEEINRWWSDAKSMPHFIAQLRHWKESAGLRAKQSGKKNRSILSALSREHFLLQAIRGWWRKWLPESFGLYIRIEGTESKGCLVLFRGGEVEAFCEPDLSSMGEPRNRDPLAVVRYLSERFMVPVQGAWVASSEWESWYRAGDHWREVAKATRNNRVRLFPARLSLKALVFSRAYLGF